MITSYSKWNKKIVNKKTYLRCFSSCLIHAGFISYQPNETVFNLMSCRHFDSRSSPFISFLFLNIHQGKSIKCYPTDVLIKKSDIPGICFIWHHKWAAWAFLFCCSFLLFTAVNWNHSAILGMLFVLSCNFFQLLCVSTGESL